MPTDQKNESLNQSLIAYTELKYVHSKWITDLNIKYKSISLSLKKEEKIFSIWAKANSYKTWYQRHYLEKKKINKLDSIEILNICSVKDP